MKAENEIIDVETYLSPCRASGYLLRYADGSTYAINAYNAPERCECEFACPFADASAAYCVNGWDAAEAEIERLGYQLWHPVGYCEL